MITTNNTRKGKNSLSINKNREPKMVDILGDTTVFNNENPFGEPVDQKFNTFQNGQAKVADAKVDIQTKEGQDKSNIIKELNTPYIEKTSALREDTENIEKKLNTNSDKRRETSNSIVDDVKQTAGLEANIAAAKAGQAGRLSVGQLQSVSKDISNQFNQSLINAKKDNLNFQTALDDKLANFGLTVVDKKKILDSYSKQLEGEIAEPLIDAIAESSDTKQEFIKKIGDKLGELQSKGMDESNNRAQRFDRVSEEEAAFDGMDQAERTSYLQDKLGKVWATLNDTQRTDLVNRVATGEMSLAQFNSISKNLNDRSEQAKALQSIDAQVGTDVSKQQYQNTGVQVKGPKTQSEGTNPRFLTNTTGSKPSVKDNDIEGARAYLNKYKVQLDLLKKTDPKKFTKAQELIAKKFNLKY